MYKREVLGLGEARTAAEAILAEASKEPNRPIAVAVADDRGDLIYLARMDGCYPLFIHMAINKAYTAARFRRHTRAFAERRKRAHHRVVLHGGRDHMATVPQHAL